MSRQIRNLGEICDVLNGYAFKSEDYRGLGHRVIRITNVQKGKIVDEDPKFYDSSQSLEKYELYNGDLLISLTGNVGRVGILNQELLPAYLNQRVGCIRIKEGAGIVKPYLFHFCNQDAFETLCIKSSNGVAQKNLSTEWLKTVEIPLPPIDTQRKIAAILDKAQELIDLRKAQIEKLDEFLQSVFLDMFGDPYSNSKHLPEHALSTLLIKPSQNGLYVSPEYYGMGTCMVHMSDAFYGIVKPDILKKVNVTKDIVEKYLVGPSDLLIARRSLNFDGAAKPCRIPSHEHPIIYESSLIRISPNTDLVLSIYLYHYFSNNRARSKYILKHVTSSTISGINQAGLNSINVLLPPILLQQQFAAIVEKTEQQKALMQQSLTEMENNFSSLMQRAFRGERF